MDEIETAKFRLDCFFNNYKDCGVSKDGCVIEGNGYDIITKNAERTDGEFLIHLPPMIYDAIKRVNTRIEISNTVRVSSYITISRGLPGMLM